MGENEVLIDIKVTDEEAVKAISDATDKVGQLKVAQKELEKAYKDGKVSQEQYVASLTDIKKGLIENREVIRANEKALKNNVKQYKAAEGSLNQMRSQLSSMLQQYDNLSKAERENAEVGGKLLEQIKAQSKAVSELEQSTGRAQRYQSALAALPGPLKAVAVGFNGILQSMKALIANPVGAVIAAIVVTIKALVDAFKRSDDAMTSLQVAFGAFQPIAQAVRFVLEKVVETIGKIAVVAANAATALLSLIPSYKKAKDEAQNYAKEVDALEDQEREYAVESAKNEKKIAELRSESADKTKYSAEERQRMLKQALDLERKNMEGERDIAQKRYEQEKANMKRKRKMSDEDKNRLAQLEAAAIKAETDYYNGSLRLQKQYISSVQEMEKEAEEKRKQNAEAAKERRSKELTAARELEDKLIEIIENNEAREVASASAAGERKIDDLKKRLKEEKNLSRQAREDINALIVLTEQQTQDKIKSIHKKYRDEELKAEQDAADNRAKIAAEVEANKANAIKESYLAKVRENEVALKRSLMEVSDNIAQQAAIIEEAELQKYISLLAMDESTKSKLYKNETEYTNAVLEQKQRVTDAQIQQKQAEIELAQGYIAAAGQITGAMEDLFNAIGGDNEKMQGFMKALALSNIAISTAQGLAEAVKAGAGLKFPENIPAIASGIAAVLSGIASAKKALEQAASVSAPKFATGGYVKGPGSEKSDSIHAKLSNGEYVLSAKTTKSIGVEELDRINFGHSVAHTFRNRFATGGLVTGPTADAVSKALAMEATANMQPVVSVKEITRVANRVRVKETIANK